MYASLAQVALIVIVEVGFSLAVVDGLLIKLFSSKGQKGLALHLVLHLRVACMQLLSRAMCLPM